jgi:predicted MPP superfamily phosphohydrolase
LIEKLNKIPLINKKNSVAMITLMVFFLAIVVNPILIPNSKAENAVSGDSFTIIQISDTQFLSATNPQLFKDTTNWIVNNSANYNLKMVIHTGDIVDNINDTSGTSSDPAQWNTANIAMSSLLDAGIPYCWDAGNHDQIPWNNPNGVWLGSSYSAFNATNMQNKAYWVSDTADSKNTAVKFNYNGYEFLIVNVEYMANNATIYWMKNILDNNKGTNVIVAAHTYLNTKAGYGFASAGLPGEVAWCNNFKTILDTYPNVFLTLSGHDPTGTANMTRVGNREEIFFNRQAATTTAGQTGSAAVRIYTFNLTSKNVNTTTYSLDTNLWLTTSYNQFTFSASLKLPLQATSTQSSFVNSIGSTVTFNAVPSGGIAPYTYQWYHYTKDANPIGTNSSQLQYTINSLSYNMFYCVVTDVQGATTTTPAMTIVASEPITPIPTINPTTIKTPTPTTTSTQEPTPSPQTTTQPTTTPIIKEETMTSTSTLIIEVSIIAIIIIAIITSIAVAKKRKKN